LRPNALDTIASPSRAEFWNAVASGQTKGFWREQNAPNGQPISFERAAPIFV
jgi:hypothetical protein